MLTIGVNMALLPGNGYGLKYSVVSAYLDWAAGAGALPLLIPPLENPAMRDAYLDRVDAVCFIGGFDYPPSFYGAVPDAHTRADLRYRPGFDFALIAEVFRRELPLVGVCGGCQLLAAASGGRLIQHLDGAERHGDGLHHAARVVRKGTFSTCAGLGEGEVFEVNSFHHQAVDPAFPGRDLAISARAFDGSVECVESISGAPVIGLQFHPERMKPFGPAFMRRFCSLVQARRPSSSRTLPRT